jgi:hypothetical protein
MSLSSDIHFLTFGGGSPQFRAAAQRIGRQAAESGFFSAITIVTEADPALAFNGKITAPAFALDIF